MLALLRDGSGLGDLWRHSRGNSSLAGWAGTYSRARAQGRLLGRSRKEGRMYSILKLGKENVGSRVGHKARCCCCSVRKNMASHVLSDTGDVGGAGFLSREW